jgi:hypothetical protein
MEHVGLLRFRYFILSTIVEKFNREIDCTYVVFQYGSTNFPFYLVEVMVDISVPSGLT